MSETLDRFDHQGRGVEIRVGTLDDRAGCVDCFNAIFPVDDESISPIDGREWDWKFSDALTGRREFVVAAFEDEPGRILGAYGCQPMDAIVEGEVRRTSQIIDLMVRHDTRRIGERPGLFVHLGRRFYERFCGAGPDRQLFNYGWPVPAWRMGQRYLRYENIRDWNYLVHTPSFEPAPRNRSLEIRELDPTDPTTAAAIDGLWQRLSASSLLAIVKDHRWWDWRYRQHPKREYRMFGCFDARAGSQLRGVAVDTRAGLLRPNSAFLVDWLVAPDDEDAIRSLVAHAEDRAREEQTGALITVLSAADPRNRIVQRLGFETWSTPYFLVVASFGPDTGFLRDHWHFTMGESDLV